MHESIKDRTLSSIDWSQDPVKLGCDNGRTQEIIDASIHQQIKKLRLEGVKFTYDLMRDLESHSLESDEEAGAAVQEDEEREDNEEEFPKKRKKVVIEQRPIEKSRKKKGITT